MRCGVRKSSVELWELPLKYDLLHVRVYQFSLFQYDENKIKEKKKIFTELGTEKKRNFFSKLKIELTHSSPRREISVIKFT